MKFTEIIGEMSSPKDSRTNASKSASRSSSSSDDDSSETGAPKNPTLTHFQEMIDDEEKKKGSDDSAVILLKNMLATLKIQADNYDQLKKDIIEIKETINNTGYGRPPKAPNAPTYEEYEREHCVVISGVSESKETKPVARAIADNNVICALLDECDIEVLPVTTYRMGNVGERPRLMKLKLPTRAAARQLIMTANKKLKGNETWKGVHVRASLSPEELEARRKLQTECNDRRKIDNKDYVIYGSTIVERATITKEWKKQFTS